MRCASLAVLGLLVLQGCGDDAKKKGTCETADATVSGKKVAKEMCCKDGKPGDGKPSAECCKNKDAAALKKCLKEEVTKLAKAAETPAAPSTNPAPPSSNPAPVTPPKVPSSGTANEVPPSAELEVADIVVNSIGKTVKRE